MASKNRHANEAASSDAAAELLQILKSKGYTERNYPEQLTKAAPKDAKSARPKSDSLEQVLQVQQANVPASYGKVVHCLSRLELLSKEAKSYISPVKKPDLTNVNWLMDYRQVISGYRKYFASKALLVAGGARRSLDVILNSQLTVIAELQKSVSEAIAHSANVANGLSSYIENILEPRLHKAGHDYERATSVIEAGKVLLEQIAAVKPQCAPEQYTLLSTADRNIQRHIQHESAALRQAQLEAVQNDEMLQTTLSLESTIRAGMLELNNVSSIIQQTLQDVSSTTPGAILLKSGYKDAAEALSKGSYYLAAVVALRMSEVEGSKEAINNALMSAKTNIIRDPAAFAIGSNGISSGSSEQLEKRSIEILAKRGVRVAGYGG